MKTIFRAATAALAFALLPAAAIAEPVLGKVESLYVAVSRDLLIAFAPGMNTHERPLVAEVRLRDSAGQPARRVFLRLAGEEVEAGDVVAVHQGTAMRNVPLQSRDRLARIEAKHHTETARNFFGDTPKFVAFKQAD